MIAEILKLIAEKGPMLCVAYSRIMRHETEPSNNSYDSTKENRINMNDDFAPFELAVKLKEKGFRKPCVATYDKDGMLGYNYYQPKSIKAVSFDDCLCISDDLVLAPTIPQVLKWLREEKKIHIVIDFDGGMGWYYQIALYGLTTYEKESEHKYNSYEQAALAGIEYVLDNLI